MARRGPVCRYQYLTYLQYLHYLNYTRWGDIYAGAATKKMIALYDYDPMELSPNVDMEVGRDI